MTLEDTAIVPVRGARITIHDAEAIARLVATRKMTERECCLNLGIKEVSWWNWKLRQRNSVKYEEVLSRLRGAKINQLVERIESASLDAEMMRGDKLITRRGDWRAAAWLTEKIAPERFAQQINQSSEESKSNPLLIDAMKRVFSNLPPLLPPAIPERSSDAPQQGDLPASPRDPQTGAAPAATSLIVNRSIDNRAAERVREGAMADEPTSQSVETQSVEGFNPRPDGQAVRLPVRRIKEAIKAGVVRLPVRKTEETRLPIRRVKINVKPAPGS